MRLIIIGKPLPQCRPRFSRVNGFVVTYDPSKNSKAWIKLQILEQFKRDVIVEPLRVDIVFYMPVPSSSSKKKKIMMLNDEIKHSKKPDLDNLAKSYLDCMNGIVFKDDSLIYELNLKKIYGEELKTEINIITDL